MIIHADARQLLDMWARGPGDVRCTLCDAHAVNHEWVDYNDQTMEIVDCSNVTVMIKHAHEVAAEVLTRRARAMGCD